MHSKEEEEEKKANYINKNASIGIYNLCFYKYFFLACYYSIFF